MWSYCITCKCVSFVYFYKITVFIVNLLPFIYFKTIATNEKEKIVFSSFYVLRKPSKSLYYIKYIEDFNLYNQVSFLNHLELYSYI